MSTTKLLGFPQSSYVWTARAAFALKGLEVEFEAMQPPAQKSEEHLARHPWGKVPVLLAGDLKLYETTAIVRWVEAHDGPALFPAKREDAAKVEQWISAANCYLYEPLVLGYVLQYVFAGEEGPDRAAIDAALPKVEKALVTMDAAIGGGRWLVGDSISAADLFVGPLLFGLSMFPEGKALIAKYSNVQRLMGALSETPQYMSAAPKRD